jgi:hypothetical protein
MYNLDKFLDITLDCMGFAAISTLTIYSACKSYSKYRKLIPIANNLALFYKVVLSGILSLGEVAIWN